MIFERKNKNLTDASELEAIQYAAINPSHEAVQATQDKRRHFLLDPNIHPWSVENRIQAQMAAYAVSYANDRMAEAMMFESERTDKKGNKLIHKQVNAFTLELSRLALERLEYARRMEDSGASITFTDDERKWLHIGNLMPAFPEYQYGYEREEPLERDIQQGIIIPEFIRGINRAALGIQTDANELLDELERYPIEVPSLYVNLVDLVRSNFIYGATDITESSKSLLESASEDYSVESEAYEQAYVGYVQGALGFTALHCPAILGEDWVLSRSE